jgi:amino acid transporter|tara:strand:- start:309 stop:587 length:279 start_codon:yes stop_codon:yes gene_type:complete
MTDRRRSWEDQVKYAMHHKDTIQAIRERKQKLDKKKHLKRLVPIPILVGVLAALVMYNLYGGEAVLKAFLSWVIGLTLIAAIITYLPKNLAK